MFKHILFLALLCVSTAHAATFTATGVQTPWGLYAGAGTGSKISSHPDFDACVKAAAAIATKAGTMTCKAPASNVTVKAAVIPANPYPNGQTQVVMCVAPATGSWSQTRTYSWDGATWIASAWAPSTMPAGACVTSTTTWTLLGSEYETFTVPANSVVRYGAGTTWSERTISGSFECGNALFGDPLPGTRKQCELKGDGTPTPPPVVGSATLSWTAPTTNADGTPLTDLAGYRVLYGSTSGVYTQSLDASASPTTVPNLAAGPWFFVVQALDTSSNASAVSAEVSKTVR